VQSIARVVAFVMSLVLAGRVAGACVGDCNGNGSVTVDKLITMVNIALGNQPVAECEAGDVNSDGQVTINEIVAAVDNALSGCVVIRVGSASGAPGSRVTIAVTLGTAGRIVIGTQNDISFAPDAPIVGAPPLPECTPNAQVKKDPVFNFQPAGCTGSQCTGVRAGVFGFSPDTVDAPIPDGSTLYTCNVTISPQATPGSKRLKCSMAFYSDPQPMDYPADCTDGEIVVGGP